MNEGYVLAGYGITVVSLAFYALRILRRGRALAKEAQRWP